MTLHKIIKILRWFNFFTDKERATMGSLSSFFGNLFLGIVALLIGLTADVLDSAKAILLAQLAMLPVIFIYLKLFKNAKTGNRTYH